MSDQLKEKEGEMTPDAIEGPELRTRRDFLRSLGRWSSIVIGGAVVGGIVGPTAAQWINRGGAWVNGRGGGGAWVNRAVGGGAWVNGGGGGSWVNRSGGGGAWVNNRGGGGAWVNRRY